MLIDRKHTAWGVTTALLAAASIAIYAWDVRQHAAGKWGSTAIGLTMGIAALLIMLFCAGLGLRRRVPHWRIGRAQTWLRGHLWLGLLTALLVCLHADFAWGGTLTGVLWVLLILVTVSGVIGVALQQTMPSLLLHGVPGETVYQQIDRALGDLPELAQKTVIKYAGSLDKPAPPMPADVDESAKPPKPPVGGEPLRRFYHEHVAAFLAGGESLIGADARTQSLFASLRTMSPPHVHEGAAALEEICRKRLDLLRQKRYMRVLLGWLIFHVPASWALLVLSIAHGVVAFRFG